MIGSSKIVNGQSIEITCDTPVMINNNHVGNEWSHALEFGGNHFSASKAILIETSSLDKVNFVTSERNEKYPDSSSVPLGIDATNLEWNKSYSKTIELTVRESNGQYAGNTAKWQVTVHYKKLQGRA